MLSAPINWPATNDPSERRGRPRQRPASGGPIAGGWRSRPGETRCSPSRAQPRPGEALGGPSSDLASPSSTEGGDRRTFYAKVSRHSLDNLLRLFDFPDPNITSRQAGRHRRPAPATLRAQLSEFMERQAKALAARLTGGATRRRRREGPPRLPAPLRPTRHRPRSGDGRRVPPKWRMPKSLRANELLEDGMRRDLRSWKIKAVGSSIAQVKKRCSGISERNLPIQSWIDRSIVAAYLAAPWWRQGSVARAGSMPTRTISTLHALSAAIIDPSRLLGRRMAR